MKQLKPTALLCLIVLAFISCNQNTGATDESSEPLAPPSNIIPIAEADQWYKNYGTDKAPILEEGINDIYPALADPYEATRFVTADYETLKNYIAFIDKESSAAGVVPSGLRIYFAATNSTTKSPGKETVFMNPVTSFKGITGEISYAIATNAAGNKTAVTVGSVLDGTTSPISGANLLLQGGSIQSLAGDDLGWPPPPYPNDPNDYH